VDIDQESEKPEREQVSDDSDRPPAKYSWLSATREALEDASRRDEQEAARRVKAHRAKKLATLAAMLSKPKDKGSDED
jgi:hypothetical protein